MRRFVGRFAPLDDDRSRISVVAAEPATVRGRPQGRIGYVFPTVAVRESSEYVALFQPRGMICKSMGGPQGGPGGRYLLERDGTHQDVYDAPEAPGFNVAPRGLSMVRDDAEVFEITAPVFDGLYEYRRRAVPTGRDPS